MLLSNRRIALQHLLIAAMQAAWISAFLVLAWPRELTVGTAYAAALLGLVAWMLALELLSRAAESPLCDVLAFGGLLIVSERRCEKGFIDRKFALGALEPHEAERGRGTRREPDGR